MDSSASEIYLKKLYYNPLWLIWDQKVLQTQSWERTMENIRFLYGQRFKVAVKFWRSQKVQDPTLLGLHTSIWISGWTSKLA